METEHPTLPPERPAERTVTPQLISSEKVLGRTVLASQGTVIGSVERMLIDLATWKIDSVDVKVNRDVAQPLGLKKGVLRGPTIRIAATSIQSIGDAIILGISISDLRARISVDEASVH